MDENKVEYIGQAKNGRLSFFRDKHGQTLIDYNSNRVGEFIGERESSMRAYREGGKLEAHLHAYGSGVRPTLRITIPCTNGRSITDADIDDLVFALKNNLFSPEDIKLDKTLEGIFKLFMIRQVM